MPGAPSGAASLKKMEQSWNTYMSGNMWNVNGRKIGRNMDKLSRVKMGLTLV